MGRLMLVIALLVALAEPAAAGTLDDIKSRGSLTCGVNGELPGFSVANGGQWMGFNVDYCRAYAAAIFGDPDKVKFVSLTAKDRFDALRSGAIDVLVGNTTWSPAAESQFGLLATEVNYYDGQGFLVHKAIKINSADQLNTKSICVQQATTSESNLIGYFGPKQEIMGFVDRDDALKAYAAGKCDAFTADASTLYGARLKLRAVDDHVILSDLISRELLSPYVRKGDDQWFNIVRWTHFALLNAEILAVTQLNVDRQLEVGNGEIKQLLGGENNSGEQMGLTKDWAYRIIKRVGNYAEIFDQNLGRGSPLQIRRGLNALWNAGGVQYAPAFR
ncbi:MAG: amino acid ABC transporter substrate-binding protein [Xanthobacteraceae bacterium]|nr:amino acid ABC transporter substrate-binding protein [Xanthobacteraceae bacterium]MBV9240048.1 amino acid ABC transporter substrate-binding protein [Xanthobacteraceae bacterium]MBV9628521.1 amino acid ABC transporter substrate-binding protein [Xanthobacteraceae bacterium]